MKELTIPVKYYYGDTLYTTKQVKIETTCHVCEGKKTIEYNGKVMRCPECNGRGVFTSTKTTNVVCEEPYVITKVKVEINSDGGFNVKYRGHCGSSGHLNRPKENLFTTKEDAQRRCDELNMVRDYKKIDDIVISEHFKSTNPLIEKIQDKLSYYKENGKFDKDIVVNKDNLLVDGYITYLICKMFNIHTVRVIIKENATIH